jgi:hypothetical protein
LATRSSGRYLSTAGGARGAQGGELLCGQGLVHGQKLDPGLEIRPTLLQNLPGAGISRFDQLAHVLGVCPGGGGTALAISID